MSWRDNNFYFNPHENWIVPSSQDKNEVTGEKFKDFGLFTIYTIWGQIGIDFYTDRHKNPYEDTVRILRMIFASIFNPRNKDIIAYVIMGWARCMTHDTTPLEFEKFFESGYVPARYMMKMLLNTSIHLKAYEHQIIVTNLIHKFYPDRAPAQRMSLDIE